MREPQGHHGRWRHARATPPAHLHGVDREVHQPKRDYRNYACEREIAASELSDTLAVREQDAPSDDAEGAEYHCEVGGARTHATDPPATITKKHPIQRAQTHRDVHARTHRMDAAAPWTACSGRRATPRWAAAGRMLETGHKTTHRHTILHHPRVRAGQPAQAAQLPAPRSRCPVCRAAMSASHTTRLRV